MGRAEDVGFLKWKEKGGEGEGGGWKQSRGRGKKRMNIHE